METSASKKRILILGGGFGGVTAAHHLERLLRRRPNVEIVLVSRDNFVLITPLLFEVFSGTLDLRSCSVPVRAFLRATRFVEATVQGIDLDRRKKVVGKWKIKNTDMVTDHFGGGTIEFKQEK